MTRIAKKVLLIGWDAADWKFLTPLMDKGLMPNLSKLVEGGVKGRLATLDPPLSPTLWTSIATGKRPYKHGIHGFTEPDPSGKGIRPIFGTNRKVKAIWNILTQHQLKTHVVGWWPSHPAEPINGVMVSDFYHRIAGSINKEWPLKSGTIHPENLSDTFAKLRLHPEELTQAHILPFVPEAYKIDQGTDKRLIGLTKTIADCTTIHSATTYILDNFEWDFTAVYLDSIDHFCHAFMKYHPPHRPHIPKQEYELYKDVVNGACIYHDMMLGRLMEIVNDDTTIMLISDHGFHPDHNRPVAIPDEPAGPAIEHSPYGIIVINGPGIKKDELIFGASLLDITPTILTLFGLPVAEDMDGKTLIHAFENPPEIETIKSWENIKGEDGSHQKDLELSQEDNEAELKQLIDLGYIEDPGDDIEKAIIKTKNENDFYLARAYYNGNKWLEGIEILERLFKENADTPRYAIHLAKGYQTIGKFKDARTVIDALKTTLDRESPHLDLIEGQLLIAEGRNQKALKLFLKVEQEAGTLPELNLLLSNAYLKLNQLDLALSNIKKALSLDPENVSAHFSLGRCYLLMTRYKEAADAFLESIGLMYYSPSTHFFLGEALMGLERYEDAAGAFDTCIKLAPGMNLARQKLITIYEQFLNQPGKAIKYKIEFQDKIQGTINIVSGLPRSGTSMMMQMLEAGGLDIFTDKKRKADESNPKGYYEHDAVKAIKKNKTFLKDAIEKSVKIIAQSLFYLPMNYKYRIVFMERNILEIISSQHKMLLKEGKVTNADVLPSHLIEKYNQTLKKVKEWAQKQPNIEILYIKYAEINESPFMQAMLVNDFFEGKLNVEKMAAVVENKLYREKIKSPNNIVK